MISRCGTSTSPQRADMLVGGGNAPAKAVSRVTRRESIINEDKIVV